MDATASCCAVDLARKAFMSDAEIPDEIAIETLPLDAWHRARGGRMVPFAGYEMPVQYEGIMAEHLWVRESAGLFDVSHMGQLLFRSDEGADLVAALEAVLPADIAGLGEGKQRYSLLLAEDGGILDDLMVTRLPDANPFDIQGFYMVVNGATKIDETLAIAGARRGAARLLHVLQGPQLRRAEEH